MSPTVPPAMTTRTSPPASPARSNGTLSSSTSMPFHVSIRPTKPTVRARSGSPNASRARPARPGLNSDRSASSCTTSTLERCNCEATASEIARTCRAKWRARKRSTLSAARDCTTISRACHTCSLRAIRATAHAYQLCRELLCTTSAPTARERRQSPSTLFGHATAYASHAAGRWLVLMRRMGTTWSITPAEAKSAAIGEGAGRATCTAQPAAASCRVSRSRAWSEPPRSATGWTDRSVGG